MVKQYELMVLLAGGTTPEQQKTFEQTVAKLLAAYKGKVETFESLGRRPLAYPIRKQLEAFYLLFTIALDTLHAQAFERDIRLSESVLRSLFIIKETPKKKKSPKSVTIEAVQE